MSKATYQLTNFTYDELTIGQSASMTRTVSDEDVKAFSMVTHDYNAVHLDEAYAGGTSFKRRIAHGMWTAGLVSSLLGTRFPGIGVIYLGQTLKFSRPVYIDDTLTVTLTVTDKNDAKQWVTLDCRVVNQDGKVVLSGVAQIIAPSEKVVRDAVKLDDITLTQRFNVDN